MSLPRVSLVRHYDCHRLVPSCYRPGGDSVLTRIADDDAHLQDLFALDHATNDRLLAENNLLPGIGVHELVFAPVPSYRIINASFCHAHPLGSRFNSPERGAWYAAFELPTAQAEVIFHKTVDLAEVGRFEDSVTYDDYLSDISAALYDLRDAPEHLDCLAPDSYMASQELAHRLLDAEALGVVYPSVRRQGGTCVACFRPALVSNVRRDVTFRLDWNGSPEPRISIV